MFRFTRCAGFPSRSAACLFASCDLASGCWGKLLCSVVRRRRRRGRTFALMSALRRSRFRYSFCKLASESWEGWSLFGPRRAAGQHGFQLRMRPTAPLGSALCFRRRERSSACLAAALSCTSVRIDAGNSEALTLTPVSLAVGLTHTHTHNTILLPSVAEA